jgi:hypothetical protein
MTVPGVQLTYQRIVDLLPSYLERKDDAFKNQIPTFINLAENRLATDMKQEGFQAVVTGNFITANVMQKPAFWRQTISFSYKVGDEWKELKLRQLEYLKKYWPRASVMKEPVFYADYNANNFYIAPTPDFTYEFELVYYARLEPLSTDNQTNWMTLNAPQALLYASLWEAAIWCVNAEAEQRWMQHYQIATGGLINEDKERKADRNVVVS